MRTEQEMKSLILNTAISDERIRAVLLSGSRADIEAVPDEYQDYDIIYFVNSAEPFYNNMQWIHDKFGVPLIIQTPDIMQSPKENMPLKPDFTRFAYLMIFPDGNRIDLTVTENEYIYNGEPAVVLLDKDKKLSNVISDSGHWHVKKCDSTQFGNCCNEFWWCLNNVAKGIARDELPYVMEMYNVYVRDMLNCMTEWYIGVETGFAVSAGKCGKYFKRYLSNEMYERLLLTYCEPNYDEIWKAVYIMCGLFSDMAVHAAARLGFQYNIAEEQGMRKYLNMVQSKINN